MRRKSYTCTAGSVVSKVITKARGPTCNVSDKIGSCEMQSNNCYLFASIQLLNRLCRVVNLIRRAYNSW